MKTIALIIGLLLLTFVLGKIYFSLRFKKQVTTLLANVEKTNKVYSVAQLEGLPAPVQRYFKHVLLEGQPEINTVRLTHSGFFKTDLKKDFTKINGEQYFSANPPQFIWKGETSLFTARDFYIDGKGGLIATIGNVYNIVNAKGSQYDEGELQRWLAESVWFPTNLLPSDNVQWSAIDELTAKLLFHYKSVKFEFIVNFNADAEIVQIEGLRHMTETKIEKWICKMTNYKTVNQVKIPFAAQAIWKIDDIEYCYAKFEVQTIAFNIVESF